jgi:DNA-binding transcriptional MerR regulator
MAPSPNTESDHKISQVVESTGVSKELIHHYLRQGLLPPSSSRARYSDQQVRLLHLIRRLREEHHLPLEVIRRLFELFEFDPARLEPLVLVESLGQRITRYAHEGEVLPSRTLSAAEVAAAAGVTEERLADYVQLRLITPLGEENGTQRRYSLFDANIVALCERGLELGIPFDSFRTMASYVRVGFQLEHVEVLRSGWSAEEDLQRGLGQLFVRREIAGNFVQNVLQALIQRTLHRSLEEPEAPRASLDGIVYRPSQVFVQRHRVQERIDRLQQHLGREGRDGAGAWLQVAELLIHAGRYREASFFLEQGLERWPDNAELGVLYGIALVLLGHTDRGAAQLEQAAADERVAPLSQVYLALALFTRPEAGGTHETARIYKLVEAALAGADAGVAVRTLGGWLLTALPPAFRDQDRGRQLLAGALSELDRGAAGGAPRIPGLRERQVINAAYLLHECLGRMETDLVAELPGVSAEDLRARICRLDPGCAFAQQVFLQETTHAEAR